MNQDQFKQIKVEINIYRFFRIVLNLSCSTIFRTHNSFSPHLLIFVTAAANCLTSLLSSIFSRFCPLATFFSVFVILVCQALRVSSRTFLSSHIRFTLFDFSGHRYPMLTKNLEGYRTFLPVLSKLSFTFLLTCSFLLCFITTLFSILLDKLQVSHLLWWLLFTIDLVKRVFKAVTVSTSKSHCAVAQLQALGSAEVGTVDCKNTAVLKGTDNSLSVNISTLESMLYLEILLLFKLLWMFWTLIHFFTNIIYSEQFTLNNLRGFRSFS